ncbi:MAG: lactoylglutathione lyase [Candidatus Margulisbacteria bacterium]|nr:lactoylglutathione lyase [Candidatus Margulisiibacteriota bacterium]
MRFLHTMLRVKNLDESITFYETHFQMKLLRKKDFPEGEFTLAFMGYGDETTNTVLEFTYNWGVDSYDIGTAYGHIAIGVDDIYAVCENIRGKGGKIIREPGPMKHGKTVLAFIEDPNGYKVELLQR